MNEEKNKIQNFELLSTALSKTLEGIPTLDSSIDYWLVRARSGKYYTDFNLNNYIGIDWNSITIEDIQSTNNSSVAMKTILRDKLTANPEGEEELIDEDNQETAEKLDEVLNSDDSSKGKISENQYGNWAGQLLRFVNNLKINDIVVVPSVSSEFFLVGRISGDIYELSDEDLEQQEITKSYKKSNFKKRWPVEWWGSFDRTEADSALYKMIYSQATVTNINDYKPFINRAMFPFYIEDDSLHLTFQVSQPSDIDSYYLGQFIYEYSKMSKVVQPENKLDVKVNVQSEGVIELISSIAKEGLLIFSLLALVTAVPFGGKLKIFGNEFDIPGFIKGYQDMKSRKLENDSKSLDNINNAYQLAEELKVPISQLGIKLPKELQKSLEENLEDIMKEEKDSSVTHEDKSKDEPSDV